MNIKTKKIIEQFERVFNKYQNIRKQPIQFDHNTIIYRSELHMIESIGNYENINVTKLAVLLGITKGAVSQCVDKLCKKDMILKRVSPLTDNEVILTLTERGKKAFDTHNEYHKKMYEELDTVFSEYPKATQEALINLLIKFENYLK